MISFVTKMYFKQYSDGFSFHKKKTYKVQLFFSNSTAYCVTFWFLVLKRTFVNFIDKNL